MAAAREKVTDETEVTATELAIVLGVTARRIQQLTQDGTILTVKRGRFLLCDSVKRYISFATRRQVSEDIEKANVVKVKAEATMKAAKSKIVNMEAQELSGQMHRAEDIKALTEDLVFAFRHALVSLPGRLSMDVAAAQTAPEAAAIIRREVNVILKELAQYQYDPDKYAERVRERRDWDKNDDSREDVNE